MKKKKQIIIILLLLFILGFLIYFILVNNKQETNNVNEIEKNNIENTTTSEETVKTEEETIDEDQVDNSCIYNTNLTNYTNNNNYTSFKKITNNLTKYYNKCTIVIVNFKDANIQLQVEKQSTDKYGFITLIKYNNKAVKNLADIETVNTNNLNIWTPDTNVYFIGKHSDTYNYYISIINGKYYNISKENVEAGDGYKLKYNKALYYYKNYDAFYVYKEAGVCEDINSKYQEYYKIKFSDNYKKTLIKTIYVKDLKCD